jgi:hypothetical protein
MPHTLHACATLQRRNPRLTDLTRGHSSRSALHSGTIATHRDTRTANVVGVKALTELVADLLQVVLGQTSSLGNIEHLKHVLELVHLILGQCSCGTFTTGHSLLTASLNAFRGLPLRDRGPLPITYQR